MEETKLQRNGGSLVILLINIWLLNLVESAEYTVGDDEEWNTGVNFLSWSEKYNFTVGDVLAFKYEKGEHNVYQVTEATYRSCNSSSGVLAKYESGKDEVNLTELGKYWFICDIAGHCLGGVRFVIDVNESSGTSNTDTTIPPPAKLNNVHAPKMWSMEIHVAFGVLVSFIS